MAQDLEAFGRSEKLSPYGPPMGYFRWCGIPLIMVMSQPYSRISKSDGCPHCWLKTKL
jgi:hypothetical protein